MAFQYDDNLCEVSIITKDAFEGNKGVAEASKAKEQANQIVALAKANAEKIELER